MLEEGSGKEEGSEGEGTSELDEGSSGVGLGGSKGVGHGGNSGVGCGGSGGVVVGREGGNNGEVSLVEVISGDW